MLARQFDAERPNQRWVGDTTEFVIGSSAKLSLAAILDLYSRFIVGWALSAVNDRHLTLKALNMAVKRRCPDPGLLRVRHGSAWVRAAVAAALCGRGIRPSHKRTLCVGRLP